MVGKETEDRTREGRGRKEKERRRRIDGNMIGIGTISKFPDSTDLL